MRVGDLKGRATQTVRCCENLIINLFPVISEWVVNERLDLSRHGSSKIFLYANEQWCAPGTTNESADTHHQTDDDVTDTALRVRNANRFSVNDPSEW